MKLVISIKINDCIKDKSVLVYMFNNHYINIVEKTSSIALESLREKHENHVNISKIKCNWNEALNL